MSPKLPFRACAAVRTFARTLTSMPTAPASALPATPKMKPTARRRPSPVIPNAKAMTTVRTIATAKTTRYSRRRNAMAPSRIAPAISRIRSSPSSSRRTRTVWMPAYASPSSAAKRTNSSICPVERLIVYPREIGSAHWNC